MDKTKLLLIQNIINRLDTEFTNVDCLIRILKEIISNKNWETREEDVGTISEILVEASNRLSNQVKKIKAQLIS